MVTQQGLDLASELRVSATGAVERERLLAALEIRDLQEHGEGPAVQLAVEHGFQRDNNPRNTTGLK